MSNRGKVGSQFAIASVLLFPLIIGCGNNRAEISPKAEAAAVNNDRPRKVLAPVEAMLSGEPFPITVAEAELLINRSIPTLKFKVKNLGSTESSEAKFGSEFGNGPGVVLYGDKSGLKRTELYWKSSTEELEISELLLAVVRALCDERSMPGEKRSDIRIEQKKVIDWVVGPAKTALNAAITETPDAEKADTIRTRVAAVFASVRLRGRVSVDHLKTRSYYFVFTPGLEQTGAIHGDD